MHHSYIPGIYQWLTPSLVEMSSLIHVLLSVIKLVTCPLDLYFGFCVWSVTDVLHSITTWCVTCFDYRVKQWGRKESEPRQKQEKHVPVSTASISSDSFLHWRQSAQSLCSYMHPCDSWLVLFYVCTELFSQQQWPWVGLIICQRAELETVRLCQHSRSHAGVVGLSSAAARNAAGQLSGVPAECLKGASDTIPRKQVYFHQSVVVLSSTDDSVLLEIISPLY